MIQNMYMCNILLQLYKKKGHITQKFTRFFKNKFHINHTMKVEKTCKVQMLILTIL